MGLDKRTRVLVTGLGSMTPLALTMEATWQGLLEGRSGVGPVTQFDASGCPSRIAGELKGFDPKRSVFNFPYNSSTPELEKWLRGRVMAFLTGGAAINALPHRGQVRLTCTSFGPGNCERAIDRQIEKLLERESGWLIFNTHGLDTEGWGPIRAGYLDRLLKRLTAIESVAVLPAGKALAEVAKQG